jgi:hypothetical protein
MAMLYTFINSSNFHIVAVTSGLVRTQPGIIRIRERHSSRN